jgi:phosphoglycolate phosphatase-like HAD superfamily hydrolase
MLYLFDIDGTLVDTGGAGMRALQEATHGVFGCSGPDLDLAGSTDLGIVAHIHDHFGIVPQRGQIEEFFEIYQLRLLWNLACGNFPGRILEGVAEVLEALAGRPHATLGLLTGNTAAGAAAKLRHFKLDSYFAFGAYGSDHADRNQLGPIALARAAAHAGRAFTPAETLVIGDTPKDIACARALGARCLAVATGQFSAASLSAHGADLVVDTLDEALAWL